MLAPRMRTLDQCVEQVREMDPETNLTRTGIKEIVITNDIPHAMVGKKMLINLDAFMDFLTGSPVEKKTDDSLHVALTVEKLTRIITDLNELKTMFVMGGDQDDIQRRGMD